MVAGHSLATARIRQGTMPGIKIHITKGGAQKQEKVCHACFLKAIVIQLSRKNPRKELKGDLMIATCCHSHRP